MDYVNNKIIQEIEYLNRKISDLNKSWLLEEKVIKNFLTINVKYLSSNISKLSDFIKERKLREKIEEF